jgi:hypothetical protein
MVGHMHLEELISMREPIKIFLEGDTNLGKFIRNIEEPMIFNFIYHIIMALMLNFLLVHIPPTCRPINPSTPSFILMAPQSCKPHHLNARNSREDPSHAAIATIDIVSYYETRVSEEDKVSMWALEYEVHLVREFKEES